MIQRVLNKDVPIDKLRLHASEKNSDWSENIFNKFLSTLSQADVKFYPNVEKLYGKIKEHYEVANVAFGTGSDKCIEYFFVSNLDKKNVVYCTPSFPMYSIYSKVYNFIPVEVPYRNITFPYQEYLDSITPDSICILTNPGSPLGDILPEWFIKRVLEKNVPTLLDEAYIEFSDSDSYIPLLSNHSNLYITRTFSKAYGSAGVRFGIITSSETNISKILQFRSMYEINSLTLKWIETLLDNFKEVEQYYSRVKSTRELVVNRCKNLNIPIITGHSNWVHIQYENLPPDVIFKLNCTIPGSTEKWIRLQITDNIEDYTWLQ